MIGTMVLVLMGCGSAVFAGSMAGTVGAGVGTVGVALAFGLSVVAMAYAIGGISGCHINPAITLGVFLSGRMNGKDAGMYMLFQVIGAIIGSAILYALVTTGGHDGPTATGSNGFGDGEMLQAFIAEVVFTFIFVLVVLGSTDPKKGAGAFAGLAGRPSSGREGSRAWRSGPPPPWHSRWRSRRRWRSDSQRRMP